MNIVDKLNVHGKPSSQGVCNALQRLYGRVGGAPAWENTLYKSGLRVYNRGL